MSKQLSLRDAIAPLLIGVGVAVSVIACSPTHSSTIEQHVTTQQSAQAKADARAMTRCLPSGSLQQIELAKSLGSHSGRAALEAKCGIPPQHRQAFEAGVLSAVEHGQLTTSAGRQAFFSDTLPQLVEANQG